MSRTIQIAIDGPAGAGKSSIAKILAKKLGYIYIDTGAMYRVLALKALDNNIDFTDENALINLARNTEICFKNSMESQKIYCDGKNVTELIRRPDVSQNVSIVATIGEIRSKLVKKQREFGFRSNVVMDGRDIGTVVFPNAKFKFYLTASLEERARRRAFELKKKGFKINYEEITKEIKNRDKMDTERKVGPLKPAKDAIIIDTSDLNIQQVVTKLLSIIGRE